MKADLEQVINLTKELIVAQTGEIQTESAGCENSGFEKPNRLAEVECNSESTELVVDKSNAIENQYEFNEVETVRQPIKHWQVGEQCQALWHKDGQ